MIPDLPGYVAVILIATTVAIAAVIWAILSRAAGRAGLPPGAQRRVRAGTAAFFGTWLAALLVFAPHPSSLPAADPFRITPLIPFFFAASSATVLAALWRSSSLRRALAAVPLAALNAVHTWRLLGIVFVLLYAQGKIPAHFALPAGWGDVAIGLTAPLVALALVRGARGATPMAVTWNVIGLLDLAVAVGMGTGLLVPLLPLDLGPRVPPAAALGVFPLILVPAFAVPLAVLVHVLALRGLLATARFRPSVLAAGAR